jgi:predicted acylesterase/phospholipase RssA
MAVKPRLGAVQDRDLALVLSGGGMNGVLLELGFLQRLREDPLWARVGHIYGTSAGALSGTMATLDRLDDLERFLMGLQPSETFRPHRLWRLPLLGLHDYALPSTIAERIAPIEDLAEGLAAADIELVVCATDVTNRDEDDGAGDHLYELTWSSRTAAPEEMGPAVLASAAISALVLPLRVGDHVATDGGWVRNFPLAHAYAEPRVGAIVAFRYVARYPRLRPEPIERLRLRLRRFRAVPPIRAFIAELEEAEDRMRRGEPGHLADMIVRLMRVSISRNTAVEERWANERDESVQELARLRSDLVELTRRHGGEAAAAEVDARFAAARFPFRHDRHLPRVTVRATAGGETLDPGFRTQRPWTDAVKRRLIERGYRLTDEALRDADLGGLGETSG